ncbi:MAG: 3-hydroxyacyl-CoA dehydrogenase [Myxococcales bacterium]|nr:3-hydroxyacyl-CoA dehydrogenase [Myxococcales bacterium]
MDIVNVEGIVALVSGGASGLGRATAELLAQRGASVVIADRSRSGAKVAEAIGHGTRFVQMDVTSEAEVSAAVEVAKEMGPLRVAVNCAGIGWAQRTTGRTGEPHGLEAFQNVIAVNLVGSFNVLRLAASAMSQTEPLPSGERGVIVNTASIAAYDGQIGQVAYAASKGGIVGMTLPAARDLSKALVRVVTIAPGLFDTPLLAMLPEDARKALEANIPNPSRLGDPAEYARLVESIVTNPYLNGETIRLDASLRMAPK